MKNVLFAGVAAVALSGCAIASQFGITPQSAPVLAAIGVETRAGANCIREAESGRPPSALHRFRVSQGRLAFDATVGMSLSEIVRDPLRQSRSLTDSVCPALPHVTAPLEAEVPVEPTP